MGNESKEKWHLLSVFPCVSSKPAKGEASTALPFDGGALFLSPFSVLFFLTLILSLFVPVPGKKNLFLLAFTENAGKKFWCTYDSHTHMVKREKFRFAKSTRSYTIIVALGTLEKSAGVVIALGNFGRAGMVPLGSSLSCW